MEGVECTQRPVLASCACQHHVSNMSSVACKADILLKSKLSCSVYSSFSSHEIVLDAPYCAEYLEVIKYVHEATQPHISSVMAG